MNQLPPYSGSQISIYINSSYLHVWPVFIWAFLSLDESSPNSIDSISALSYIATPGICIDEYVRTHFRRVFALQLDDSPDVNGYEFQLKELRERQKQQLRQKALKKGLDPE